MKKAKAAEWLPPMRRNGRLLGRVERSAAALARRRGSIRALGRFDEMPSSVIRRFAYDPRTRTLDVEFVSGRRYRYFGVPGAVARAFGEAFSKGRFFNARIRDGYRCRELAGEPGDERTACRDTPP